MSYSSNLKAFKETFAYAGIRFFLFADQAEFVACMLFTKSSISASEVARSTVEPLKNPSVSSLALLTVRPHFVNKKFVKTGKSSI